MTWLANFLSGILVPILEKLLASWKTNADLSAVEKKQTDLIKASAEVNSAQTTEEKKKAIEDLARADNE